MILPQRDVENRTSKESVQTFDPYPGCLSAFPTNQVTNYKYLLKPVQNKKGQKNFQLHRFLNPFLQLAAEKKDSKKGAARRFFGPSNFVTALGNFVIFCVAYENERLVSLVAQICCKFLLQIIIMRKTKTLKLKTSSHLHNQVCTKFKARQTSNPNLSIQILEAKVQISFLCCTRNIVCVFF